MHRLVLVLVPCLWGLFSAYSHASMVVISGQGVVQDVDIGHQGYGFEEGASFWAEFRYITPILQFSHGQRCDVLRALLQRKWILKECILAPRDWAARVQVADSAVKRFRLNALNMVTRSAWFPGARYADVRSAWWRHLSTCTTSR